ncbi:MAG TPA: hypothetical protein VL131_04615 [Gammaproteobacteria bacterium]|nr:hypothetical protein [Gammaproteobacteria bacterium]
MRRLGVAFVAGLSLIAGCTSTEVLVAHSVPLEKNKVEIPETQLLDVGVAVFNSGVPEGEVDKDVLEHLIKEGTFVQIRRSEALYMAVLLRDTMQKSDSWGSVWVTPKDSSAADLSVDGKILHSDGDYFQVHIKAVDATGRTWVDKNYQMSTAAGAFNRQRYPDLDPYQDVFNEIANDLAKARGALSAKDTQNLRKVAGLRYAADLSPEAFSNYVVEKKGVYEIQRLPADGDPMYDRTERVRQRERLFLDTIDQHYDQFYKDATKPYNGWRENARAESIEVKEATKTAHWRTGMGVASIVASLVYGSNHGSDFTERMLRDAMLYIGMDMLRTSQVRKQEIELHRSQLEELNSSFDDEIKPVVVQIQGTEHRLTGTADAQYQEWRDLLRRIFIDEGGAVPEDLTVYAGEPEPSAPRQDPLPTLGPPASSISLAAPVLTAPADGATPSAEPAGGVAPTDAPAPAEPAPAQAVSDAPASVANGG